MYKPGGLLGRCAKMPEPLALWDVSSSIKDVLASSGSRSTNQRRPLGKLWWRWKVGGGEWPAFGNRMWLGLENR